MSEQHATRRRQRVLVLQEAIPHYRIPLFDQLADGGLEVTVCHSGPATQSAGVRYREQLVPVHRPGPLLHQPGALEGVADFDVVVAHFEMRSVQTLRLLFAPRRPPIVLWGHGFGRRPWVRPLRRVIGKRADALLFYDESTRDEFAALGYPAHQLFVAPNTIYVENAGLDESTPRTSFLFVGRLQERKRVHELLEAFARAAPQLPPETSVTIVGAGDARSTLEHTASTLGITDRVDFTGAITDDNALRPHFSRALAYVSPGDVGLSVLHSFAYGVPVVTARVGRHGPEVRNVIDGRTGFLYEGGVDDLAERLVLLATQPRESLRMGRTAHEHFLRERPMSAMVAAFAAATRYAASHSLDRFAGDG